MDEEIQKFEDGTEIKQIFTFTAKSRDERQRVTKLWYTPPNWRSPDLGLRYPESNCCSKEIRMFDDHLEYFKWCLIVHERQLRKSVASMVMLHGNGTVTECWKKVDKNPGFHMTSFPRYIHGFDGHQHSFQRNIPTVRLMLGYKALYMGLDTKEGLEMFRRVFSISPSTGKFLFELSHICGTHFCNMADHLIMEPSRINSHRAFCHRGDQTCPTLPQE